MAVALDDLRGHFIHLEAEQVAHDGFHFRRKHGVRPHGPGELAHAHVVEGGGETGTVALEFGIEARHLEREAGGLGVDAVGAAHAEQTLMLQRHLLEHGEDAVERLEDQFAGFHHEQRTGGIHDVGRRTAQMDEPGNGADLLFNGGQEGDDVVTGGFLDFVGAIDESAINGKIGFLAERFHVGIGNFADAVPRLAYGQLNAQPSLIAVLGRPDFAHFRAGIAFNHGISSQKE